jgi:hypothetical protein
VVRMGLVHRVRMTDRTRSCAHTRLSLVEGLIGAVAGVVETVASAVAAAAAELMTG